VDVSKVEKATPAPAVVEQPKVAHPVPVEAPVPV